MPDRTPFFTGKFKSTGEDLETWIRHCLSEIGYQRNLIVDREDFYQTKKRFTLYFMGPFCELEVPDAQILSLWGGADLIEWSGGVTEILGMWITVPLDPHLRGFRCRNKDELMDEDKWIEERYAWLQELVDKILERFELVDQGKVQTSKDDPSNNETAEVKPHLAPVDASKSERKVTIRIPRQPKRLHDWKVVWRKIKGGWKSGDDYRKLAKMAGVSEKTIAGIVKAGDAGLLD